MNTLFIIGNGFDLNLDLNTDYPSFYKYYLEQSTSNKAIQKLKEDITQKQYSTWADLEEGLGKYAENCSKEDYLMILDDIRTNLLKYLKEEDQKMAFGITDTFYEDLKKPERHLERVMQDKYYAYYNSYLKSPVGNYVDIITFNYTYTLERILDIARGKSIVKLPTIDNSINLDYLLHIHGTLDNELDLGINDPSQLLNDSFKVDMDILENVVKSEFNDACLNGNNSICERYISEADVIVLFGVSLGVTDKKWWSLIGERLINSRCIIIYYPFDEKKDESIHPNSKRRWSQYYNLFLKKQLGISEVSDDALLGIIVVGTNKPIFKYPNKVKLPSK